MPPPHGRRRYRNPPLTEAVLEFQFLAGVAWDSIFLGKLHDRLPDFPVPETIHGASVVIEAAQVGIRQAAELKRFWREDRGIAITVGPELLGISTLPAAMSEGHSWETLRNVAYAALKEYRSVARPGAVRQVGLRYINSIAVDPSHFRLSEWVTEGSGIVPHVLLDENQPFSSRLERITKVAKRYQRREVITLAAQPAPPSGGRVLLDVDQVAAWPDGAEPASTRAVVEDMHDAVHGAFERIIRPEVLERFGPEELSPGGP
ncbi:hypothetical protein BH23GEM4_BH23GEM4_11550 [soil metagenome]